MKPEWGTRRNCNACATAFFDMNRTPITCPKCQKVYKSQQISKKASTELNNSIEDSEEDLARAKLPATLPVDEIVTSLPVRLVSSGEATDVSKKMLKSFTGKGKAQKGTSKDTVGHGGVAPKTSKGGGMFKKSSGKVAQKSIASQSKTTDKSPPKIAQKSKKKAS